MADSRPRTPPLPRRKLDLEALKFALLAFGMLALMLGAALYLIQGDLTIVVRVALAAGIVLLGAYVAIDPEDVWRRVRGRGVLYSGNTLVMAAAGLGILGLVNVLAARPPIHQRVDLTANQQFSLSEQSINLVKQLPAPVTVTGYFVELDRAQRENAETLLKQYQAAAGGKITYDMVDPEQRPAQAQQAGVRQSGTLVFQMGQQKQSATGVGEQEFTSALLKLVNPTPRKVYFTTGHGERDTNRPDEAGYSSALQLLQKENFAVDNVNLVTARKVPDDASVLIIAAPTKPFLDEERKAVQEYLNRGGSLMLLLDTTTTPQVADYLAPWNIKVQFSPVIDPTRSLPQDPLTPVVDRYIFHAITKNMNGIFTVYPVSAGLIFPKDQKEGVFTAPLAESSDSSWIETNLEQEAKARAVRMDAGQDIQGPITLVGVIEANAAQQPPTDPNSPTQSPKKTRAVVGADSDFISNQILRLQSGNPDLFLNAMNWLTESEQLISIRPKDQDVRQLVLSGTQANTLFWTSVVFLPLLVLGAGAFVWWTRR